MARSARSNCGDWLLTGCCIAAFGLILSVGVALAAETASQNKDWWSVGDWGQEGVWESPQDSGYWRAQNAQWFGRRMWTQSWDSQEQYRSTPQVEHKRPGWVRELPARSERHGHAPGGMQLVHVGGRLGPYDPSTEWLHWDVGYGWPCVCLVARSKPDEGSDRAPRVMHQPDLATGWPTHIYWPGLAANSAIFAAIAAGLWFATAWTRRRVRLATGRCPSCSYSLAGLTADTPCPECGNLNNRSG